MTIALSLALTATIIALAAIVRMLLSAHRDAEIAWTAERRELLTRIQRPEHVPVTPIENFPQPEAEPDESDLVGTITYLDGEPDESDAVGTIVEG